MCWNSFKRGFRNSWRMVCVVVLAIIVGIIIPGSGFFIFVTGKPAAYWVFWGIATLGAILIIVLRRQLYEGGFLWPLPSVIGFSDGKQIGKGLKAVSETEKRKDVSEFVKSTLVISVRQLNEKRNSTLGSLNKLVLKLDAIKEELKEIRKSIRPWYPRHMASPEREVDVKGVAAGQVTSNITIKNIVAPSEKERNAGDAGGDGD